MYFYIRIDTREEMIAFGNMLAKAMQACRREKPWIINIGADDKSGKSLIALATDQIYNPQRYPHGIIKDMIADTLLAADPANRPSVVFENFNRLVVTNKSAFDEKLSEFETKNPGTQVLIAANIDRTIRGEFDYPTKGLQSDRLDISVQVYKETEPFGRSIDLVLEDEELAAQIGNYLLPVEPKRPGGKNEPVFKIAPIKPQQ